MPILTSNERIGTEIGGRYRLTRLIGEGAFGAVFEAEHTLTGRAVALKLLHAHLVQTEQISQRFLLEAQAMAKIRHPGIVQVLDAGREPDGTIFLALELLEGETLEATLTRLGRMTRHEAVQITIEILDALAAAHARDIIHRDIKPANIFLAREGGYTHAKVLDFGIAHVRPKGGGKLTNAGVILGTPEYMSPEQGRGAAIGPAADLWSVGILLYEMLSGLVPWSGESATAVLMAVANDPLPDIREFVPEVPGSIVRVLERVLQKRPEDRFASALEMRDTLSLALLEAGDELSDRFVASRPAGRGIGSNPTLTPGGTVCPRTASVEMQAVGARGGNREFDLDLASESLPSLDLDVPADATGGFSRVSSSNALPTANLPLPPSGGQPFARTSQLPPPPELPPASYPRTPSGAMPAWRPADGARITGKQPAVTPADVAALRITGKQPVLVSGPGAADAAIRTTARQPVVSPDASERTAARPPEPAPRGPAAQPAFNAPPARSRTGLLVGLPLLVIVAGVAGMVGLRMRGDGNAVTSRANDEAGTGSTHAALANTGETLEAPAQRELSERYAIALPFGVTGDDARMFARHLAVGPSPAQGLRTLATCARGTLYLYSGGDGLPAGSGPAPLACEQHDLAALPDLDGDGMADVAAVTRGHDGVAFVATHPVRVLRTTALPRVQGLVGGLTVAGQPAVVAYVEPEGATSATELVAIGAQSGQVLWRISGRAPLLRLGHPADQGLAVGPDATGDGVPDVVAGAVPPAALPAEQVPARPRCVELFSGATGERVWREPFCQGRGGSQSVSLGPDLDGDGRGDVAVGTDVARAADPRVVLISGADAHVLRRVPVPTNAAGAGFGWPVFLGPDLDGDGASDLAVGSVGSTGTHVSVVSSRDGALRAHRELRGAVGFPNLRLVIADGLVRGGVNALAASTPEDGLHVFILGDGAQAR